MGVLTPTVNISSVIPQAFNGIHPGGLYRLIAHRQQGNEDRAKSRRGKDPPGNGGPVMILLQPAAHKEPRDGGSDEERDKNQQHEFRRQRPPEIDQGGAEYFPYADLPGTLLGYEGCQPIEPKAADQDGKDGEEEGNYIQRGTSPLYCCKVSRKFPLKAVLLVWAPQNSNGFIWQPICLANQLPRQT